ncbi:hypothetical protein [Streptomyces silvensis]|uniref:Oxidoreductase n=1 Tax=Streptomyces silvensis TaxID=1765722 RepID=A0A0W7WRZ0_9ACTN|nr:hypothetical protein [Streptomyces silvensis]KUF13328.1 hypothetical protein AT728_33275 [Streptomyces silvensis]
MPDEPRRPSPIHKELLARGARVDLRPRPGEHVDAGDGENWGDERAVDAAFLAELLTRPTSGAGAASGAGPTTGAGAATGAGATSHRAVWLAGARITGVLDLEAAHLTRPLHLEDCWFEAPEPVVLNDARAFTVQLPGCHLHGFLANCLQAQGDVCLGRGFTSDGEVQVCGAHIQGALDCDGGVFRNVGGTAVDASGVVADGGLWFEGARVTGLVDLITARTGGQLNCTSGVFDNSSSTDEHQIALRAYGIVVADSVFLRADPGGKGGRFEAHGEVVLRNAQIGGDLDCTGGGFRHAGGRAVDAYGMVCTGTVLCRDGFAADGEVMLHGARIGGNLQCNGGTFRTGRADRLALDAQRVAVDGNVNLRDKFDARGGVSLLNARVGGDLSCKGGRFLRSPQGKYALRLLGADVTRRVRFLPTDLDGTVDLRMAKVGGWQDTPRSWDRAGRPGRAAHVRLNGFTYTSIQGMTTERRLAWLARDDDGFAPQPYRQLADVHQREGDERGARQVRVAAQLRRRERPHGLLDRVQWPFRMAWTGVLWATMGFGYWPWRILLPIGGLYSFGCWWFARAEARGQILRSRTVGGDLDFHSARYTADLLIPGAGLGERSRFYAVGDAATCASVYTLAGWALAAMLIAGLTGVFKRL